MTAPDPMRDFPELEMRSSLDSFGGWLGWLGQGTEPCPAIAALQWKASQGDELPDDILLLRDAFAQFGYAPIEEADARVRGLEKAFAEISEHLKGPGTVDTATREWHIDQVRGIVDSCVKFSGGFGDDDEEATDAEA